MAKTDYENHLFFANKKIRKFLMNNCRKHSKKLQKEIKFFHKFIFCNL